jgi:hypothetical protein
MYCPLCRAEYRAGFTECSDCQVALVPDPPPESFDRPSKHGPSFAPVWSGDDPGKHAEIRDALDRQEIPTRTIRREDHLFNPTAHAAYEVYVPVDLIAAAREAIHEAAPEENDSEEPSDSDILEIPAEDGPAYGDSDHDGDDSGEEGERSEPSTFYPEDATAEVWSGDDPDLAAMIASSLRENDIPYRSDEADIPNPEDPSEEISATRLFVLPRDNDRARTIVQQILNAAPPE